MVGYITLGTNDLEKSKIFYDALLSVININRLPGSEDYPSWGESWDAPPALSIVKPFDSKPATGGNGTMIAIRVDSNELVDLAYNKAIELGAKSEGAAGPRGTRGFYAGYFRDPDGNKLNFYCR